MHYPPLSYTPVGCHFPDPSVSGGVIYWEERWDDLPDFMGGPVWGIANPLMYGGANGQVAAEGDFWFGDHPGFSYSIRAYDEGGGHTSEWSDIFSGTVTGTPSSGTSDLAVTVTSGSSVSLTWSGEQGMYYVLGGNGAGATYAAMYPSFGVPMSISGLAAGNWKFVVFTATSAMSNVAEATLGLPAAPAALRATIGSAKDRVRLSWDNTPSNESGFNLQYKESTDTTWTDILDVPADTATYEWHLPPEYAGKTYNVRVAGRNSVGDSAYASADVSGLALVGVDFRYDQGIKRDSGTAYAGPEWLDTDMNGQIALPQGVVRYSNRTIDGPVEHQYPVSYGRSGPTELSMTIRPIVESPLLKSAAWKIKGLVTGGSSGTVTSTSPVSLGSETMYADTVYPIPGTIDRELLNIDWQLSTDGGITWFSVGESENRVYVTGVAAAGAFETIVDLGCTGAAGRGPRDPGDTPQEEVQNEQAVADGVWDAISGRSTTRVDGVLMKYNHETPLITTLAGMLSDPQGRGQCTAWTDLLVAALAIEGVWASSMQAVPKPGPEFFVVNAMPAQGTGTTDYTDAREFASHMVVRIDVYDNCIFDPSYGTHVDQPTWELSTATWECLYVETFVHYEVVGQTVQRTEIPNTIDIQLNWW